MNGIYSVDFWGAGGVFTAVGFVGCEQGGGGGGGEETFGDL